MTCCVFLVVLVSSAPSFLSSLSLLFHLTTSSLVQVFPYLLHNESLMFSYDDCNFKVQKYKKSAARFLLILSFPTMFRSHPPSCSSPFLLLFSLLPLSLLPDILSRVVVWREFAILNSYTLEMSLGTRPLTHPLLLSLLSPPPPSPPSSSLLLPPPHSPHCSCSCSPSLQFGCKGGGDFGEDPSVRPPIHFNVTPSCLL